MDKRLEPPELKLKREEESRTNRQAAWMCGICMGLIGVAGTIKMLYEEGILP